MPERPPSLPPVRQELLAWFRYSAPPLAPAYEGALRLLTDFAFPGRLHFIAQGVRDICNRLIDVLDPQKPPPRVQYENEMDEISKVWPALAAFEDCEGTAPITDEVAIPYVVASRLDALVRAHRERRQRPPSYELLFRFLMRREPRETPINLRLVEDFKRIREWFTARAHFRAESPDSESEAELQTRFCAFERILHSFVGSYFTTTKELDDILRKANQ